MIRMKNRTQHYTNLLRLRKT